MIAVPVVSQAKPSQKKIKCQPLSRPAVPLAPHADGVEDEGQGDEDGAEDHVWGHDGVLLFGRRLTSLEAYLVQKSPRNGRCNSVSKNEAPRCSVLRYRAALWQMGRLPQFYHEPRLARSVMES